MSLMTRTAMAAIFASAAGLAQAATISTATVISSQQTNVSDPVVTTVDTDTANDGTATASSGPSSAVQNADGTSEVNALTGAEGFFGGFGTLKVTAEAVWQTTETNTFNETRLYTLDFVLEDLATILRTTRNYGSSFVNPFNVGATEITDSSYTAASFQYIINVNGTDVYTARADVLGETTFIGGIRGQDYSFDNVSNFTASIAQDATNTEFYNFTVDDLTDTIELGTFDAGEEINITSTLRAIAQSRSFEGENGVGAFSSDPITLSSVGNIQSTAVTVINPVPLPAAAWMLLAGLGAMGAMKRRR